MFQRDVSVGYSYGNSPQPRRMPDNQRLHTAMDSWSSFGKPLCLEEARLPLLAEKREKTYGIGVDWPLLPDFSFRGVTSVDLLSSRCFFGGCQFPGRWWASVSSS